MKELLEQRDRIKAKKPKFRRHDSHKKAKLSSAWRRPRGLQNKLRLGKRGYTRGVENGWGSPRAIRGMTKEGLVPVVVSNVSELENIDVKTEGIIIDGKVGIKKKVVIIETAGKTGLKIINLDSKSFLESVKDSFEKKKEAKKIREEKKAKTKKETEKEAKKKEQEEKEAKEELSDDEKKDKEKKDQDKILTTKKE